MNLVPFVGICYDSLKSISCSLKRFPYVSLVVYKRLMTSISNDTFMLKTPDIFNLLILAIFLIDMFSINNLRKCFELIPRGLDFLAKLNQSRFGLKTHILALVVRNEPLVSNSVFINALFAKSIEGWLDPIKTNISLSFSGSILELNCQDIILVNISIFSKPKLLTSSDLIISLIHVLGIDKGSFCYGHFRAFIQKIFFG